MLAYCDGALPVLRGRVLALGGEDWVVSPMVVGREEMRERLGRPYVDTAGGCGAESVVAGVGDDGEQRGEGCLW